jgi:hypothetical protein
LSARKAAYHGGHIKGWQHAYNAMLRYVAGRPSASPRANLCRQEALAIAKRASWTRRGSLVWLPERGSMPSHRCQQTQICCGACSTGRRWMRTSPSHGRRRLVAFRAPLHAASSIRPPASRNRRTALGETRAVACPVHTASGWVSRSALSRVSILKVMSWRLTAAVTY